MFDGSITIDTRIDTKGMNKGTRSITQSLGGVLNAVKGVMKVMAAAFIGGSIINAIRGIVQSFDLMSFSVGGNVKQLSDSFGSLKGAFVNLIATALVPLIPYVVTVINWLTSLFQIVTQIIAALFGLKSTVGSISGSAAGGAKKVAKEAKGALAAFDEINVLQTQQKEEDSGGGGAGGPSLPGMVVPPELLDKVQKFKEKMLEFLKPVIDAFGRLVEALKPLGQTIWEGLKWAWDNVLVPFGTWVVNDLIPKFFDLLAQAADTLNTALIALKPLGLWLWETFLKPAAEAVGDAILKFLDWLIEGLKKLKIWIENNQNAFQIIVLVIGLVALALFLILNPIWLVVAAIIAIIAIIANWGKIWEWIKMVAALVWESIQKTWKAAGEWFRTTVIDPIKKGFETALDAIKKKFESIFEGIKSFIKGVINSIIDYINNMIQSIVGGINSAIRGVNAVSGGIVGFSILPTVTAPQIPRLATGAVIPPNSEFVAMLGDQRSGKNLEAPEGLIRQIIQEEIGSIKADIKIEFGGSLSSLVRQLQPIIKQENIRVGKSLISQGSAS